MIDPASKRTRAAFAAHDFSNINCTPTIVYQAFSLSFHQNILLALTIVLVNQATAQTTSYSCLFMSNGETLAVFGSVVTAAAPAMGLPVP